LIASVAWIIAMSPGSTLVPEPPALGAAARVEHRGLALEAVDRAVDVDLAEHHRRVVDQVAGREVVGAVDDDVVVGEDGQGVGRGDPLLVDVDPGLGIEVEHAAPRRLRLRGADVLGAVDHLALEVRQVDHVEVHDPEPADAGRGEVQRQRRAEPAGADQQHRAGEQLLLPRAAELGQAEVAGVTQVVVLGQGHGTSRGEERLYREPRRRKSSPPCLSTRG
jgi:hypothetical protein